MNVARRHFRKGVQPTRDAEELRSYSRTHDGGKIWRKHVHSRTNIREDLKGMIKGCKEYTNVYPNLLSCFFQAVC